MFLVRNLLYNQDWVRFFMFWPDHTKFLLSATSAAISGGFGTGDRFLGNRMGNRA